MGERKPRLFFYFLHLLGVGHVHRAKRLIEAFAAEGLAVDIVYGGMPLDGISFTAESIHHLPPIQAEDASYKRMLDAEGNELSSDYMEQRIASLLGIFAGLEPDVILTEAFPFGRRIIRHEMDALFAAARARPKPPLIVSSVRDILQEKRKPGRSEEARDWVRNCFDHVLVHADPNVIALDATFSQANEIEDKLAYTGFVI
ncbi:MAG: glycosyl transferase, partial [Rhizobiaceae bacterium]